MELEKACSVTVSEEVTKAKEQLGTSRKEGASLLSLQWNKDCDSISVNFPSESTVPTKQDSRVKWPRYTIHWG